MARYTVHRIQRRAWHPTEIEQLVKLYPTTATTLLAGIFGRDKSSVTLKAKELKLQRAPGFLPLTKAAGTTRKPRTKFRGTFSDTPAAPNNEDAIAILAIWHESQALRFKKRVWERRPPPPPGCVVNVI